MVILSAVGRDNDSWQTLLIRRAIKHSSPTSVKAAARMKRQTDDDDEMPRWHRPDASSAHSTGISVACHVDNVMTAATSPQQHHFVVYSIEGGDKTECVDDKWWCTKTVVSCSHYHMAIVSRSRQCTRPPFGTQTSVHNYYCYALL